MPEPELNQPVWRRRPRAAGIVTLAIAWFLAARLVADRSASGITLRLGVSSLQPLVMAAFLLFLLLVGLALAASASGSRVSFRDCVGLPKRASAPREWSIGAAIGWGASLVVVLPIVLARDLRTQLWFAPRAFWLACVGLLTLALLALAEEIIFRGYPYRRLVSSMGTTRATILMSLLYGITYVFLFNPTWLDFMVAVLFGLLLSLAWLRTHGLWLPWGLHFAWKASLALLFGLPVAGASVLSSIVDSQAVGPVGLTGGILGPGASRVAVFALLLSIAVLFPLTHDYEWNYTHPAIIPGGYPLEIPPSAAHRAMEQAPTPPPPLVQILPSTPQSRSAPDPPA